VPARSAVIPIVDSVFTRVGASDDLSGGQSTFMVEMSEVASILKNATSKSLIIFDEIGRGTSTYDGMSIARAVLEYAADKKKLGAKTLFATHYHELTELENTVDGVKNYNISVKKRGDDITFLRRIVRGCADGSYGIDVAKLAGVPDSVVKRARQVLSQLESDEPRSASAPNYFSSVDDNDMQLSFASNAGSEIVDELKTLDINTLTPIEAMSVLYKFVQKAKET
jgi:DNA mismatch repair protein MutS